MDDITINDEFGGSINIQRHPQFRTPACGGPGQACNELYGIVTGMKKVSGIGQDGMYKIRYDYRCSQCGTTWYKIKRSYGF